MPQSPAAPLPGPAERRRLREANGLSQSQLAKLIGVTRETVRSWETGRTSPRGRTREAYAEVVAGWRRTGAGGAGAKGRAGGGAPAEVTSAGRTDTASARRTDVAGNGRTGEAGGSRAGSGTASAGDSRTKGSGREATVDGAEAERPTPALLAKFAERRAGTGGEAGAAAPVTAARPETRLADAVASRAETPRVTAVGAEAEVARSRTDREPVAATPDRARPEPARERAEAPERPVAPAHTAARRTADSVTTDSRRPTNAATAGTQRPGEPVTTDTRRPVEPVRTDTRRPAKPVTASTRQHAEPVPADTRPRSAQPAPGAVGALSVPEVVGAASASESVHPVRPAHSAKAVEHAMSVKPVELAQRGERSQSKASAEAAAPPASGGLVDLVEEDERGRERKGRKGARTRPKSAAKRAAKPAGTGPARDEHSGVPRDHHGEHGAGGPRPAQAHGSGGGAGNALVDRRATATGDGRRPGDDPRGDEAARDGAAAGDGPLGPDAGTGAADGAGAEGGAQEPAGLTPAQAFDALYAFTAPGLVRQTYLLTGRRALAKEAVERAFHKAWEQWPEVAKDRDPVGWVRAAAYEYALSPWHRLRRSHRHPDAPPAEPEDRKLLDTLLSLPPSYRRTLVLYDGVGLDLPETAAETEASTPAAAHRLVHAREAVAARLPELSDPGELQRRLDELACAEKLGTGKAPAVRGEGERRVRFWTRAAIAFTALIIGASAITWVTSAKDYEPPQAPGQTVTGVPPMPGPEALDGKEKQLRKKLRSEPGAGPERIHPLAQ